jgi:L-methionine (R)-S-oxide reductase
LPAGFGVELCGAAPYVRAMAEDFDPARLSADKGARYAELALEVASVLEGEHDRVARMATVASMLHHAFDAYFWTGFYVVDPKKGDELLVGPYQGTLGCLRIAFGRGVCGTAAAERRTVIVDDVDAFPGHIPCDSRSKSEIVTPVFDPAGKLIAVFDVDSDKAAAFDEVDAAGIKVILKATFA